MSKVFIFLVTICFFVWVSYSEAAKIYLYDGTVITGVIVKETTQLMTVETTSGSVTLKRAEIKKIEYHKVERPDRIMSKPSPTLWKSSALVTVGLGVTSAVCYVAACNRYQNGYKKAQTTDDAVRYWDEILYWERLYVYTGDAFLVMIPVTILLKVKYDRDMRAFNRAMKMTGRLGMKNGSLAFLLEVRF